MAVKFFISYSRNDDDSKRLVAALQSELKRYGHEVFVDLTMNVGTEWEEELKRKIAWSDEFILLLSVPAVASEPVREELRHANALSDDRKRPRIFPVYVKFDGTLDRELQKILGPIQHLTWRSDADTAALVSGIRAAVALRRRPRVVRAAVGAIVVVMVLVLFVYCRVQVSVLTRAGVSDADAIAAYNRLRNAQRLLLPRAWLIGAWNPRALAEKHFRERARQLDEKAAKGFSSTVRQDVDRALIDAALAALRRGSLPTADSQKVYDAQNYDRLVTTLRGGEELQGTALAVRTGAAQWRIDDGRRVWTCILPLADRRCEAFPTMSRLSVVISSAFLSDDELMLVGYSGELTRLNLKDGSEPTHTTSVSSVAVESGDVAIGFDYSSLSSKPASLNSVTLNLPGGSSKSLAAGKGGDLKSLAFGPCKDCLTLLGVDGSVKTWNWSSGAIDSIKAAGNGRAIASNRSSGRLAIVDRQGRLELFGRDPARPLINLRGANGLAMSPDGRRLAVVYSSSVRILEDGKPSWTLISADKMPTPVAATFAGDDMVVTRSPTDIRLWRLDLPKRRDMTPYERWAKWRKQLGLDDGGSAHGQQGPARFRWDPIAGEVKSY